MKSQQPQSKQEPRSLLYEQKDERGVRQEKYAGRLWKNIRFYLDGRNDYVDLRKKVFVRGKQQIPLDVWHEGRYPIGAGVPKEIAGKAYQYRYTLQ